MESEGLREEDVLDRTTWKNDIKTISATPDDGTRQMRRLIRRMSAWEKHICTMCAFIDYPNYLNNFFINTLTCTVPELFGRMHTW